MAKSRRSRKPVKCRFCTWVMRPVKLYDHIESRHPERIDQVDAEILRAIGDAEVAECEIRSIEMGVPQSRCEDKREEFSSDDEAK